jgi:hypothetical protein
VVTGAQGCVLCSSGLLATHGPFRHARASSSLYGAAETNQTSCFQPLGILAVGRFVESGAA